MSATGRMVPAVCPSRWPGPRVTVSCAIDEINQGCRDLPDGKNICSVVIHDH
jgi:hypothetical protein